MKITIDEGVCEKNGIEVGELLMVLIIKLGDNVSELCSQMLNKEIIVTDNNISGNYLVTQRWNDVAETVLLDSDKDRQSVDRLENLVIQLQAIFPEGKKEGTSQYWRGNKREILLRLKKFFKLYDNTYTDEQILNATKNYVTNFNGNYNYMRVLKYFIWKDENKDGETLQVSQLADWIENKNETNANNTDWTTTLR